jgi:hypothetical protein
MDPNSNLDLIAKELDSLHAVARQAYRSRDINAYRALFTEDLRYVQANGKEIGLSQLMRDVARQLAQHKSADSEMVRESISKNGDDSVTQVVRQNATYSVSVFFFFSRNWRVDRLGRYTYRKTEGGWRICEVVVLEETVRAVSRPKESK